MAGSDGARPSQAPVVSPPVAHADHPAWARLADQLGSYDRKSSAAHQAFTRFEIVVPATVPVVAGVEAFAPLTAALAAVVDVPESVQQLVQWQTSWVLYRSTAEALKHEKSLLLASAGPYAGSDRNTVLAERFEGLFSQEHARWADSREQAEQEGRSPT